ncbi:YciI family protein [Shimia sp. MIT1388]|uniref:YciI family protein n=1 Tax=Shimia sp. MIT1388 TaxID=3096992 RepID=UPI00399BE754
MTRWVVVFRDTPAMLNVRARQELRDAHVAYVKAHPEILIGGGLKLETGEPFCGALWVVELPAKADVEQVIGGDPFYVPEHRAYEIFTWGKILADQNAVL